MRNNGTAHNRRSCGCPWTLVALLLFTVLLGPGGCAPTPAPGPARPAEPVTRPDPQLVLAVELADQALAHIVRQHVEPVPAAELHDRFLRQLAEQLGVAPGKFSGQSLEKAVRRLQRAAPDRPLVPAVEMALARLVRQLQTDSVYFEQRQFALLQGDPEETASVGLLVQVGDRRVRIAEVRAGSPADRAGLKPGDELLAIDGQPLTDKSRDWILTRLHGQPGSALALEVRFADGDSRAIRLQREILDLPLVEGRWLQGGIAYVRLHALAPSTPQEFNEIFLGLIRKQRAPRALVLDLRHNRGGVLDSAVQLSDLFLAEGTILAQRDRTESNQTRYLARPRSEVLERQLPLAVLINGETAAGAESIAAALQDHRRALIVGQRSRGAGRLYTVFRLPGERGLKLATGRLYRPGEVPIAPGGVVPDICLQDGKARLIPHQGGEECPRDPGRSSADSKRDPALETAAKILADKMLYRELLEGRRQNLPAAP